MRFVKPEKAGVNMSSVKVMLVVSLFIPAVRPDSGLFELECLPAVGILAQTTVIRCFFKDTTDIQILGVYLTKAEQKEPFFRQVGSEGSGDPRFSLENLEVGPSLQISDTVFSDEGKYRYRVITDRGAKEIQFSISVTDSLSGSILKRAQSALQNSVQAVRQVELYKEKVATINSRVATFLQRLTEFEWKTAN
uniref:Uncharacterized protein n=1 Tax=Cyprinus carpio carpio TaxID=630221 RepID=A0A8C1EB43_CYPCA